MPHPQSRRAKVAKKKRTVQRRLRTDDDRREEAERHVSTEERHRLGKLHRQQRDRRLSVAAGAVVILLAALLGYAFWVEVRPDSELAGVERPFDDGRGHTTGMTYASLTPTSGAHDSRSPQCTVYTTSLALPLAVHALEHGVVVLWYDAARPELAVGLAEIADRWDSHVIVSPAADLGDAVVATAWNRLKAYPGVVTEVGEFVDTYRLRGPETVDCDQT